MRVVIRNTGSLVDESTAPDLYAEMREGSITPTSFDYREFVDSVAEPTYKESYFLGNVIRFGINPAALILGSKLDDASPSGGAGQSSKSGKTNLSEIARKVVHHSAEKHVFNEAMAHIFNPGVNAVICDILVRDKGSITIPTAAHSVILYKNPPEADGKHKITIIDPSNFKYSSHLSNKDMKESCTHPMLFDIISFLPPLQIYKPDGLTGYASDKHRDCVDIAVKLSLGLNSTALLPMLTIDQIIAHPVVVSISNINTVDTAFFGSTMPVRVKQASDPSVVMTFKTLQNALFQDLTILRTIKASAQERIDSYDEVVAKAVEHADYEAFVDIKSSKAGVITRLQSIIEKEASLEKEYNGILSMAFDPSCFTTLSEFEVSLHGEAKILFEQLDL